MLGALGAIAGVALGIVLSNVLTGYFASLFYGLDAGFHVAPAVLLASVVVGVLGPPLAALPAIRRAARLPVREALQATGSAVGGQGRLDAVLRRVGFLPRSAQIGLRGVGRRKRRSLATALQVALSVGTLLALLALGTSVGNATRTYWDDMRFDIFAGTVATRPFNAESTRVLRSTPGVQRIQPLLSSSAKMGGKDVLLWGMTDRPLMQMRVADGRWYTAAQERRQERIAVIGRQLAARLDARVGDTAILQSPTGPVRVRIVGISNSQNNEGLAVYLPLSTLQAVLHSPGEVNTYLVVSSSKDHAFIDRLNTRLEDTLGKHGAQITTQVAYVGRRDNVAFNASLTRSITVLGLVIVAISMVGLVNAITMGILERTREIGTLRCVGARARDIRRIFATEGLLVALFGWLLGLPVGYALARGIIALSNSAAKIDLEGSSFPTVNLAITLVGTIVLALLVLLAPPAPRGAVQAGRGAALCLRRFVDPRRPRRTPGAPIRRPPRPPTRRPARRDARVPPGDGRRRPVGTRRRVLASRATVEQEQVASRELALPSSVQEALGELVNAAKDGLLALSVGVGLGVLSEMMEAEVDEVVGPKGKRNADRAAVRHGHEDGEVTLGGRRVGVSRPRARTVDGENEVGLATYAHFADRDPLTRVVLEQMLAGVSTRRFARTREPVGREIVNAGRESSGAPSSSFDAGGVVSRPDGL